MQVYKTRLRWNGPSDCMSHNGQQCYSQLVRYQMCRVWHPNSNIMSSLVHLLVSFFLVIINTFTVCVDSSDLPTCPIWTYPSPSGSKCVCGDDLDHVILCNPETLTVRFTMKLFCFMLFNSNGVNMTLLGICPYGGTE